MKWEITKDDVSGNRSLSTTFSTGYAKKQFVAYFGKKRVPGNSWCVRRRTQRYVRDGKCSSRWCIDKQSLARMGNVHTHRGGCYDWQGS